MQPHWDHNVRPCKKRPAGMQILSKDNHFSGIHATLPLFRVRWILHGNRSSRARRRLTLAPVAPRQILTLDISRVSFFALTCITIEWAILRPRPLQMKGSLGSEIFTDRRLVFFCHSRQLVVVFDESLLIERLLRKGKYKKCIPVYIYIYYN